MTRPATIWPSEVTAFIGLLPTVVLVVSRQGIAAGTLGRRGPTSPKPQPQQHSNAADLPRNPERHRQRSGSPSQRPRPHGDGRRTHLAAGGRQDAIEMAVSDADPS